MSKTPIHVFGRGSPYTADGALRYNLSSIPFEFEVLEEDRYVHFGSDETGGHAVLSRYERPIADRYDSQMRHAALNRTLIGRTATLPAEFRANTELTNVSPTLDFDSDQDLVLFATADMLDAPRPRESVLYLTSRAQFRKFVRSPDERIFPDLGTSAVGNEYFYIEWLGSISIDQTESCERAYAVSLRNRDPASPCNLGARNNTALLAPTDAEELLFAPEDAFDRPGLPIEVETMEE